MYVATKICCDPIDTKLIGAQRVQTAKAVMNDIELSLPCNYVSGTK